MSIGFAFFRWTHLWRQQPYGCRCDVCIIFAVQDFCDRNNISVPVYPEDDHGRRLV